MSRYRFEVAGPADDADLRHVLAQTPMPGDIALTFRREPSFFQAPGVDGFQRQIVACRDTHSGRIVGFGCRSLRRLHVNGTPTTIGYLSALRLLPDHRNQGLVARGYRFFRDLHKDGQTPMYLTTIAEGNEPALRLLTSGRAGLPAYHPAGRYHTVALPMGARSSIETRAGVEIRPAADDDWPTILTYLERQSTTRQFFPCYQAADPGDTGALFSLHAREVLLAWRAGSMVGVLAGWDQHAYRQSIVEAYSGLLRWLRPVYNGWAWLRGRRGLPRPGEPLRYVTAALPVIAGNDARIFDALLDAIVQREVDADFLVVGLCDGDPLLPILLRRGGTSYVTRIFHVCWPDGESFRQGLDHRPAYLELGSL